MNTQKSKVLVSVIMGSKSDWETMQHSTILLDLFEIPYETLIISAHRTPERMVEFAKNAKDKGIKVIIAGAGGAAHLPGMVASLTTLPVIGVPVESKSLKGMDSLLSIVQMPAGIPVATVAIGVPGAKNASILAASIIATYNDEVHSKLKLWRAQQTSDVAISPVENE